MAGLADVWFELLADAEQWCRGRSWLARLPLWSYLTYAGIHHAIDPFYRSWFSGLTLVVHEGGHLLFMPFGRTLMLLGGSFMQLLVPSFVALYLLLQQHDWFGLAVGTSWLAFSTFELATYVADANKGQLPLVGMGDDVMHDWETLLTQWSLLNHCDTYAALLRLGAAVLALASSALGAWLLLKMFRHAKAG